MTAPLQSLPKTATGIQGLDDILDGGLPRGRPTLVCGSAGCGKTLLGMSFLVHGAARLNEPGVFLAFEETAADLALNVASLGFNLPELIANGKLIVDFVHLAREEILETGEYDLEGLFIRLNHAISAIGAQRVVLDTVETLFAGLPNPQILRSELRRLFRWLKERELTTIITGERGEGTLTRQGLEEYVSDCVILLDHRVVNQISTRRVRVVKYRGATHGTNEYPFLIDAQGLTVLPVTSLDLQHSTSQARVSSGIARLDTMLGGQGYYRGSTVLVSGTAGTGKSSLAAHFAEAAARRKEKVLYFAFEESPAQIQRNMSSIGIQLQPLVAGGTLQFVSARPSMYGLELHLATMLRKIGQDSPAIVIVDPINALTSEGHSGEVKAMLMRLVDFLKHHQITALFTSLTSGAAALEHTDTAISSLIDTWLLLRDIESGGERNRGLYILKSRGMAHSNQIREFRLTSQGVELLDVYVGPGGVLTGTARQTQEAEEQAARLIHRQDIARRQRHLQHKRETLEARIASLRAAFEAEESDLQQIIHQEQAREARLEQERHIMATSRMADLSGRRDAS